MQIETTGQPDIKKIFIQIFFVALSIILPGINWVIFSWMHILLPTLAFFILHEQGFYKGNRVIVIGSALGLVGSLAFGSLSLFAFAISLLPIGYLLAKGITQQEGPVTAIAKATVVLCFCWAFLLSGIITPGTMAPYNQIIYAFNAGIDEAIKYYGGHGDTSVDMDLMLEASFLQMKRVVPIILPAILTSFGILLVWFAATVGNWSIGRKTGHQPWPAFQTWQLPEKLIFGAIICGLATIAPIAALKYAGINLLILLALVYCLQGFGITVFFMNKWKVPLLFRSFLYVMIVFQSFGTILLLIVGIADTWLNLRKLPLTNAQK